MQFSRCLAPTPFRWLSCEVPPVPIPNTEVKLTYTDNTWLATAREDRQPPGPQEALIARSEPFSFLCDLFTAYLVDDRRLAQGMLPIGCEPQRQQELFAGFVEGEMATMDIRRGFRMEMLFDQSCESLPHIPLPLVEREGGIGQCPPAFRQKAQHFLRQFRRHVQQKAHQGAVRLADQAIGGQN